MSGSTLSLTMRPRTFGEVIGLEMQVATLRKKLDSGDVPRGFLLVGPYGCGKTTLAWLIATAVQGWEFDGNPQVIEVNGANTRKIDDMRALADGADKLPMEGKYGVVILDEVHQLTPEAQQILLKELEVKNGPTVWILATTDPQKLNPGVQERCFKITVTGLNEKERAELVARAVKATDRAGDTADFLAELTKQRMTGPRKILQAFELYNNGLPAAQAVSAMAFYAAPVYFDVAMGVVFGKWLEGYSLPWVKDKDGKPRHFEAVAEQIKRIEALLTKKPKHETSTDAEQLVEEDDVMLLDMHKPECARAIRAITATLLKNKVLKGDANALVAADALNYLAHCCPPNPADTGMEFAVTIGGLYKVHLKLHSK